MPSFIYLCNHKKHIIKDKYLSRMDFLPRMASERLYLGREGKFVEKMHIERYIFASSHVKDKIVLDAACGTGYGSNMLLEAGADKVYGIDKSQEAIDFATNNYKAKYSVMDAERLEFPDEYFDVVVSFETIEHVPNVIRFMKELYRVLKKNGKLIISTPNYKGSINKNPYHISDLTKKDFLHLMDGFYYDWELYGQEKWFLPFPGRGIVERAMGFTRDYVVKPVPMQYEPQIMIGVGIKR